MAATLDRAQIKSALALTDPATSSFLDLQTGKVVHLIEGDTTPAQVELSQAVMDGYGDRYRYIPGGNTAADDAAIDAWLEAEGIS
ncbi:MAG: UPF0158 family protein [Roseiflexaceae bacterium]